MFKIVNTAFEGFKASEERRSSLTGLETFTQHTGGSSQGGSSNYFQGSTHTPHYGRRKR